MQPSIDSCSIKETFARSSGHMDPLCSVTDIPQPQSAALGLHPVAHRLLLINRPCRDDMLSWRCYTAATGEICSHDLALASPAH